MQKQRKQQQQQKKRRHKHMHPLEIRTELTRLTFVPFPSPPLYLFRSPQRCSVDPSERLGSLTTAHVNAKHARTLVSDDRRGHQVRFWKRRGGNILYWVSPSSQAGGSGRDPCRPFSFLPPFCQQKGSLQAALECVHAKSTLP